MAYSGTATVVKRVINGRAHFRVSIPETEAGAATEATISGVPVFGKVVRQIVVHDSGSGSTVDPILGQATNPSGASVVVENDTAAATVDNTPADGATYYSPAGILYHRSVCDSGSDNSVTVRYHIVEGWE